VDLEKAFDNVEWNKLFGILENLGIDSNCRRIIYQLYKKQAATIRMGDGSHIEAKINKEIGQGCNLSPSMFSIYLEEAISEARNIRIKRIKINREKINMLRFADDIATIAENQKALQRSQNMLQLNKYDQNFSMQK
jgi:hypothetical protein